MQLAVSTEVLPDAICDGAAVSLQSGAEVVTVTVALAATPFPPALLPTTVYVVVTLGATVHEVPNVPSHVPPCHANKVAAGVQVGVSTSDCPGATDADARVQTGTGAVTVTIALAAEPVPMLFAPATV